jgi:type I restriction enzyme, S subunit
VIAGWEMVAIGDLCEVVNGGTPKTGVSEYWDGPHRWITPAEMGKRATPYIDKTKRTITDLGLQNSSARPLPPYSVILSSRAPIGHLVINTEPMATNQGCKGLIPKDRVDHKFLYYYLGSIVDLLDGLGTGATFKELSGGKLKEILVPVPPISDQRRIVSILDEAFEGIAKAKASAEKNLQKAGEIFEIYLESIFISGCAKWPEVQLEKVADIINGYAFKSNDFQKNAGVKSIKITNVGVRGFVEDTDNYLPATFAETYSRVSVKKGSIVLALTRSIIAGGLKVAIVPDEFDDALLNQRVVAIRPHVSQLETKFLFAYLSTRMVMNYVIARVNTLMQPNLSISDLRQLPLPLPRVIEQRRLLVALKIFEDESHRLESIYLRKLGALQELKKSLLHQAFTGQL